MVEAVKLLRAFVDGDAPDKTQYFLSLRPQDARQIVERLDAVEATLASYANHHNWHDNGVPEDLHTTFAPAGELADGWIRAELALEGR